MHRITALLASTSALAYDNTLQTAVDQASGGVIGANDGNAWVARRSKDSEAMVPYWDLTDDLIVGEEAVKARGMKYLPSFPNEIQTDYNFRLGTAVFTNIYGDIVETLSSKPFEKEVALVEGEGTEKTSIPESIREFIENVDGDGTNLTGFAAHTFYNGVNSAVDWIFVDMPVSDARTRADEKAAGIRPNWSHVLGRNVLEAKQTMIGGEFVWSYIRIWEPGDTNYVRILSRVGDVATWELWKERTNRMGGKEYLRVDQGVFSINVIPMVPFITGRRDGKRYFFFPAMRSAADTQIKLYRQESAKQYVETLTAYPMLAGQGVKPEKNADGTPKPIGVGPGRVVYAPPTGDGGSGTWQFISPTADVLNFHKENCKETTQQMRELGRVPLTAQSSNVTVITSAAASGKTRSAVGAWALNLKNALENALVYTCMWLGISDTQYSPEVYVYTDFDAFLENAEDLQALATARTAKDISQETYWDELKRRGVLSDDFDKDQERERLLEELPGEEDLDENGNPIVPSNPGANNNPARKE